MDVLGMHALPGISVLVHMGLLEVEISTSLSDNFFFWIRSLMEIGVSVLSDPQ